MQIVQLHGRVLPLDYASQFASDACSAKFGVVATKHRYSLPWNTVIMVALWNTADHYIFILSFVLSSSFFPRLISAAADWMSAILPHMVWP